jgi:hypothetical protein
VYFSSAAAEPQIAAVQKNTSIAREIIGGLFCVMT